MNIAQGERAEAELDAFIERRSSRKDPDEEHELWLERTRGRAVGIDSRLRRLEERGGSCPECGLPPDGHGRIAVIDEERPEKSFDGDPDERCPRCGRFLYTVLRVVYDAPEGGGESYWPDARP